MRFADFSPPSSPSLDQQRDALQKGLGRAFQWAITRRLDDELLLEACLRDLRYDAQIDDSRGDWLWGLIQAVDAAGRFRVPILHALYALSDDQSAGQLCELARRYAEAGDETFRARLYDIVEQEPIADRPWLGEHEILELDGEDGFLFAARVRGKRLSGRDWHWDDDGLVDHAIRRLGERRVEDLLANIEDPALRAYREGWEGKKKTRAGREPPISHQETMRAIRVEEILSAAESDRPRVGSFRGWGMYAEESDLATVSRHLSAAREAHVIAGLLQVFSNRAAPQFVAQFIELCRHDDSEVRRRALLALGKIEHPLVREFALANLEERGRDRSVVGLFILNFRPGDERRIAEAVELPDDQCEHHSLLMDVIEVLGNNPAADCSRLGTIAYASTPCEQCRSDSVDLLDQRQVAPGWLLEECRHDSSGKIRELVAEITRPTPADSE